MCGITGYVDFNGETPDAILSKMTEALHHRGPDDSGYKSIQYDEFAIGIGHKRLSILDLSKHGYQPMSFEDYEIVYNGEVYNFQEIRNELEKEDYCFESNSDTEVILKAYHKWGLDAIHRFIGMFAMGIFDKKEQKLILIRDRVGIKPLYWYWDDNIFLFSSELKSFHEHQRFKKEINTNSLSTYLKYGYILQPYTIFKNAHKLRAGHYLEFDIRKKK